MWLPLVDCVSGLVLKGGRITPAPPPIKSRARDSRVKRTPTNFSGSLDEFGQAIMQSRPSFLSQSSTELLLSLIPERKRPVQAIRAALRKHDIPRAAVYTFYPNQALLLDSS
jgi:hypothetical protein